MRPGFLLSVGGRSRNSRNETAQNCYVRNEKELPSGTFPVWKSSGTAVLLVYGIYPVEGIGVFRVPKNGDARNKKPPALRVETKRCTKKSPFRYNRVVQALL